MIAVPFKVRWHRIDGRLYGAYLVSQLHKPPIRWPKAGTRLPVALLQDPDGEPVALYVSLHPKIAPILYDSTDTYTAGGDTLKLLRARVQASRDFGRDFRLYLGKKLFRLFSLPGPVKGHTTTLPCEIAGNPAPLLRIPVEPRSRK